jgi:hypothetical protein
MSILKNEKEILAKSEKKALEEVHDLTTRVHRLQVFPLLPYLFITLEFQYCLVPPPSNKKSVSMIVARVGLFLGRSSMYCSFC